MREWRVEQRGWDAFSLVEEKTGQAETRGRFEIGVTYPNARGHGSWPVSIA